MKPSHNMTKQLIITLEEAIAESEANLIALQKENDKAYTIYSQISERFKTLRNANAEMRVLHRALKNAETTS